MGTGRADKAEGVRRALTTPLESGPGGVFRYSDINFILLGALIESSLARPRDVLVQQHVLVPLGVEDTGYLPSAEALVRIPTIGAAIGWAPAPTAARCPQLVLRAHGASVSCRALHRHRVTKTTGPIRARIPTLIGCFGAQCKTRRRGGWGEWPGMPASSRRHTTLASLRRPCSIGSPAARANFPWEIPEWRARIDAERKGSHGPQPPPNRTAQTNSTCQRRSFGATVRRPTCARSNKRQALSHSSRFGPRPRHRRRRC